MNNATNDTAVTIPDAAHGRLAACTGGTVKVWVAQHRLVEADCRQCEATYQSIAETASVARRTAVRSMKRLIVAGLVTVHHQRAGAMPNTYTLLPRAGA